MKLKMALSLGTAVLLVGGVTTVALSNRNNPIGDNDLPMVESVEESGENYASSSDDGAEKNASELNAVASAAGSPSNPKSNTDLSVAEIVRKSQEQYATLSDYRSTGTITSKLNGVTNATTFSIHLARPDFYRIEWATMDSAPTGQGAVWSAGDGDFLQIGNAKPEKHRDKVAALAGATGVSGGAAANIPGTFFDLNWGNSLKPLRPGKKLKDESVGDVECHVLTTGILDDGTMTVWVGRQDFLIRQIQQTLLIEPSLSDSQIRELLAGANLPATPQARAEVRKEIAREQARERSNRIRAMAKDGKLNGAGPESSTIQTTGKLVRVTVQTHENQGFSATDFGP